MVLCSTVIGEETAGAAALTLTEASLSTISVEL